MKSNERGITLITLVAFIAALAILAGITFGALSRNKDDTKLNVAESELKMVQNAILQRKTEADLTKTNYEDLPGEQISKNEVQEIVKEKTLKGIDGEYKKLNKKNLEELGITNTENTYIVNYNTGEVIDKDRYATFGDKMYIYSVDNVEED